MPSGPAGAASPSSSGRSTAPGLSPGPPCATASARPRNLYDVTPDAQDLFPSNYDGLATGLMAAILEVGGEAWWRTSSLPGDARPAPAASPAGRRAARGCPARATASGSWPGIQDAQGYLSEARVDGDGIRLVQHNCAVLEVARGMPVACRAGAGPVPRGPRRRGGARPPHRGRRPVLRVPRGRRSGGPTTGLKSGRSREPARGATVRAAESRTGAHGSPMAPLRRCGQRGGSALLALHDLARGGLSTGQRHVRHVGHERCRQRGGGDLLAAPPTRGCRGGRGWPARRGCRS